MVCFTTQHGKNLSNVYMLGFNKFKGIKFTKRYKFAANLFIFRTLKNIKEDC